MRLHSFHYAFNGILTLQQENVHAILESDSKVANVRDSLNDALALLDDVNENLATFDTKLLVMREDIAAIEVRPMFLDSYLHNPKFAACLLRCCPRLAL